MDSEGIHIQAICAVDTRPLRQKVLRPHQQLDELNFPGDDDLSTLHLGLFINDELVGIASIYREAMPGREEDVCAWRLRGMAIAPELQGRGYGSKLLNACVQHVKQSVNAATSASYTQELQPVIFWCTARVSAQQFYEQHGFRISGEVFELPDIGPHYIMFRIL